MLTCYCPGWLWYKDQFVSQMGLVVSDDSDRILDIAPLSVLDPRYPGATKVFWPDKAVVPGTINTHAHSFQHLLRGIAVDQPFLVWRDQALYRITPYLDAQTIYWGAKLAFSEMLLHGITTIVDFFYVHNQGIDNDLAVIQAARDLGVRLVLARTFYDWEGAPKAYRESPDDAVARTETLIQRVAGDPRVVVHPAPHSVHGASDAMIQAGVQLARSLGTPHHIHIAEEPFETEETLARTGLTPVQHLAALGAVDSRLIGVHLTWVNTDDIHILGSTHAQLAYCPSSNMFLADGVTPIPALHKAGVRVGLGTDGGCSNNRASIYEEMRMAALLQKVHTLDATVISAHDVWTMGTREGAAMLDLDAGQLESGLLADFVGIDITHVSLLPWSPETLMANIVYAMSPEAITDVIVGGNPVVRNRRLVKEDTQTIAARVQSQSRRWLERC